MTKIFIFQLVLISSILFLINCQQCLPSNDEFLITFHPHLDAFWLNTDTQLKNILFTPQGFLYAMNQRNSKVILNSMLQALTKNQTRKYFITQVVFFKDWYEYLKPTDQQKVKNLLKNGQLQIANGGWVQNDEAICYFDDILDQYTTGLNYLYQKFNYQTRIGWATDSFGHSHSQVALLHLLGFQFQGIERVDDRYIYQRKQKSLLQFYWSPVSDSNNLKYGGLVTYVRHFLHEVNDLRFITPNSIAQDFTDLSKTMKSLYSKPKFFRFLGNDFEEFITSQFQNLEKSFSILNPNNSKTCQIYKYGNPNDYLNLIKGQYDQKNMPVRANDFMPNWDQDHYWNGYYTTDPDLKKVCKDFSRLLNLFRKIAIRGNQLSVQKNRKLINTANELVSIMQHHDGITGTSKKRIQNDMKRKMNIKSMEIIKNIQQNKNISKQYCNLYQNNNKCKVNTQEQTVYFSIFHEGTTKTEKIQLILPTNIYYSIQGFQNWQIFCISKLSICNLILQFTVKAGENIFVLKRVEAAKISNKIINLTKAQSLNFATKDIKLTVKGFQIDYVFNKNQYFNISLVKSTSDTTVASSMAWDKYGNIKLKAQRRLSGIYIMANSGQVNSIPSGTYSQLHAASGKHFTQIYIFSQLNTLTITINNNQYNIIELTNVFEPPNLQMSDYFIMVESSLNPHEQFYHDMNGYLVMKRKIGSRPDYLWQYKAIDKIAANTYPLCSFAYAIQNDKKFVIFVDRAAGVSLYGKAFLLNIDRIAGDDYKGVGQGYFYKIKNTFVQKIGLINKNDFVERKWQKQYDQPLIAFYSITQRNPETNPTVYQKQTDTFLKYTVFNVNKDQIVIRFINLHDRENISLKKFSKNNWSIDQLGIKFTYKQVRESFAHGVPLSQRKIWKTIDKQINTLNSNKLDNQTHLILNPLQIRSFRIFIIKNDIPNTLVNANPNQPAKKTSLPQVKAKNQQLSSKPLSSKGNPTQPKSYLTKPTQPQLASVQSTKQIKGGAVKFKRRCF